MAKAAKEAREKEQAEGKSHEQAIMSGFGGMQMVDKRPTEYFDQNVWIGSSFTSPREAAVRHDIGVGNIMWGNDYPHSEATYPYTREALRYSFHDTPPAELAQMLGGNAFEVYDWDRDLLRRVAADIAAPTVEELQVPLDEIPEDALSQCFEDAPNRVW